MVKFIYKICGSFLDMMIGNWTVWVSVAPPTLLWPRLLIVVKASFCSTLSFGFEAFGSHGAMNNVIWWQIMRECKMKWILRDDFKWECHHFVFIEGTKTANDRLWCLISFHTLIQKMLPPFLLLHCFSFFFLPCISFMILFIYDSLTMLVNTKFDLVTNDQFKFFLLCGTSCMLRVHFSHSSILLLYCVSLYFS